MPCVNALCLVVVVPPSMVMPNCRESDAVTDIDIVCIRKFMLVIGIAKDWVRNPGMNSL